MSTSRNDKIRNNVRTNYGRIASSGSPGCDCSGGSPCSQPDVAKISATLGYESGDLSAMPEGTNLGLGCGNPQLVAKLKAGETVLDLGSGPGFDCLLAARAVGETGRVIGVDMTPEMLERARHNAAEAGADNVEFRAGNIEFLPVEPDSVDVIISNCVINLSPDKLDAFKEAFRVLKPGGRMAVTDIVALKPMPEAIRKNMDLISGCIGGAALVTDIHAMLEEAGFKAVRINVREESRALIDEWYPRAGFGEYVASAFIQGTKPLGKKHPGDDVPASETDVHLNDVARRAKALFRKGYLCAEVTTKSVLETFAREAGEGTMRAASALNGGGGGLMLGHCGAYSGGLIALGELVGRQAPLLELRDLHILAGSYHEAFVSRFGSTECPHLLQGFGTEKHTGCVRVTTEGSQMLSELIHAHISETGKELNTTENGNREQVRVGQCPFS